MNVHRIPPAPRALLAAGLLLAGAAAQAAAGYTISPNQETQVSSGMSMTEVQSALGHPAHNAKYPNEPGPTYTYHVAGREDVVFDIDFDAAGKVVSAVERMVERGGGGPD